VVHRAIDPAPAKRYASAADLAADLEAVLERRPVTARPLTRARRFLRWARHEPWQAALLALVPGLLVLGAVLLVEFPSIARAHAAEAHTASMAHLQLGCQLFFIVGSPDEDVRTELEQALAAERDSPMALAALAIALADHDGPAAARLLDDHPRALAEHRGLQLLRAQAAAGRCCLDEAEFAALQRSRDVIDLFTAALGRLLLAQEHHDRHTYDLALGQLDRVDAGMGVANPLVKGLLAVCAAEACDARRLELAEFALHENWPDAPPAVLWDVVALQSFAPDRAITTCRDYLARHGDDLRVHQSLLAILGEQGHFAEALAHVDEMTAAGFPADVTRRPRLLVWAAQGRKDDVLRDLGTEDFTDTAAHLAFRGRLLEKFAPDSAIDCYRRGLALADPVLRAELCFRLGNMFLEPPRNQTAEGLDALRAAVDRRPEHAEYRWRLAIALTARGGAAEARPHFDRLRAQGLHLDAACWPMTCCYMTVHDYAAMRDCAHDWCIAQPETPSPLAYLGIAQSRLGERKEALELFKESVTKGNNARVHIERSWLQVDPDGDPDLRDPQAALTTLGNIAYRNPKMKTPGPWYLYVWAEAQGANGNFVEAIKDATRALRLLAAAEPEAPRDLAQRIEAALRWFHAVQRPK
jgi:tetratricopeptide (TPR) repeat protein